MRGNLLLGSVLAAALCALVACGGETETKYGAPHDIVGNRLPNEVVATGAGGAFGGPYDANANKPATTLAAAHAAKGGPGAANGFDCLACHSATGTAKTAPFSYGGRIVKAGAPAENADVVVLNGETKLGPVKSDKDGFFWFTGAAVAQGAKTQVRSAAGEESMGSALAAGTGGSCDSATCHGGTQGTIFVP